jgi:hypothetical protein
MAVSMCQNVSEVIRKKRKKLKLGATLKMDWKHLLAQHKEGQFDSWSKQDSDKG